MFDFRLKVFYTVATRLNFTKAAKELYITQPAVTKHIHELEKQLNVKLFDRKGTKIALTHAGELVKLHAEKITVLHRNMVTDLAKLGNRQSGTLRIGASTTIAQYILPALLAQFRSRFQEVEAALTISNTENIEKALENETIDLGVIEGQTKNNSFKYTPFVKDELVLVVRQGHVLAKKGIIPLEKLKNIPLLLREPGSGTLEVLAHALGQHNIKLSALKSEMQLAGTEAMKQYLLNSDAAAFLSIHSITNELKHQLLTVIDIKELSIERQLYFIRKHGEEDTLVNLFIDVALNDNLRL